MERVIKCGECDYFRSFKGGDLGYCKKFTVNRSYFKHSPCLAPEEILEEEAQRIRDRGW